jgi:hypothetical protein
MVNGFMPDINISIFYQGYSMEFDEKAFHTCVCTRYSESAGTALHNSIFSDQSELPFILRLSPS